MSTETHKTFFVFAVVVTDSLKTRAMPFVRHMARVMSDASGVGGLLWAPRIR